MAEPDNNNDIEDVEDSDTANTADADTANASDTDTVQSAKSKPTKLAKKDEMIRYAAETKKNTNLTWCCLGIMVIMALVYLLARMLTESDGLNGGK